MGVISRLLIVAVAAACFVHAATMIAVIIASDRMHKAHLLGKSIDDPVDAAIVLAGGTDPDGILSYSTRRRVKAGVRLMEAGKARFLIMSGGRGNRNPVRSQGEKMVDIAVGYGADPDLILVEPRAISTLQNLVLSFPVATDAGLHRLAIVTDAYHLTRSRGLAGLLGRPDVALVAAPGLEYAHWTRRVTSLSREAMAWWFNLLKAAGWEGLRVLGYSEEARIARIR